MRASHYEVLLVDIDPTLHATSLLQAGTKRSGPVLQVEVAVMTALVVALQLDISGRDLALLCQQVRVGWQRERPCTLRPTVCSLCMTSNGQCSVCHARALSTEVATLLHTPGFATAASCWLPAAEMTCSLNTLVLVFPRQAPPRSLDSSLSRLVHR